MAYVPLVYIQEWGQEMGAKESDPTWNASS
jgi:hypothetical protein